MEHVVKDNICTVCKQVILNEKGQHVGRRFCEGPPRDPDIEWAEDVFGS